MSAMPGSTLATSERLIADLQRQLAECRAERDEALQRETATAEVLDAINSSHGDLAPVFDAILEKALRLCEAVCGQLATYDQEAFEFLALKGDARWLQQRPRGRLPASRGPTWSRIVAGEPYVHILDALDTEAYRSGHEGARDAVISGGRTFLTVALRREQTLLGALTVYRQEVRAFSDKQIALLQNFAAQAVIAMENARLLTETREALEQQTATAEVLQVINSSPDDLAPVFDAMLEKAMRLCGADFGVMNRYDGKHFYHAADNGVPSAYARYRRERGPITYGSGTTPARLVAGENLIHTADLMATEAYERGEPARRALVDLGGARTHLTAALRKGDVLLGDISIYRQEVRPFTDKQIALLKNFAAQAVIAIENARLLTETREALEQQTATAEVLQVINSSPGDLAPVFDAMLEKARRLCEANFGTFWSCDDQAFQVLASTVGGDVGRTAAPGAGTSLDRIVRGESVVQIADVTKEEAYQAGVGRERTQFAGTRTALAIALRKDHALIGAITAGRLEVRPFTDKQIALLQNFAAQAVIAMENARLLTETREALEQQTATAEVLQVINSSPGDLAPVFDAILEKAHSLCGIARGSLELYDGQSFRAVATRGLLDSRADQLRRGYPASDNPATRPLIEGEPFTQIPDITQHQFPFTRSASDALPPRTLLCVPLRRDDQLLGMIAFARLEVRPFTDKQIALLQNFAAQAVIAMENARLITETREALERQTATAEVLQVINSSPGDLTPVFGALLDKALTLCGGNSGFIRTYDGEAFHLGAMRGVPPEMTELFNQPRRPPFTGTALGRLVAGETVVEVANIGDQPGYHHTATIRAMADTGIARTMLFVALRKEGALVGFISIFRHEIRAFSDKQIALLQNFAAQAVIAMENARLLGELRERTGDLEESLEYQTATSDVLQVISRSTFDLQPVLDTLVETAVRLCGADGAGLSLREAAGFRFVAVSTAIESDYFSFVGQHTFEPDRNTVTGRVALEGEIVHVVDIASDPEYRMPESVLIGGLRTLLGVPLLRGGAVVGTINLGRYRVEPFTERQIELVRTFADQAVIAIENTRLITETRDSTRDLQESLEYQTATSDVLKVISRSTFDLQPVLDTLVETAARLCQAEMATIMRGEGEVYRAATAFGYSPDFKELIETTEFAPDSGSITGRVALDRRIVHVPDAASDPEYTWPEGQDIGKFRTMLGVPLLREDALIGVIVLARARVEPFTERQIELVRTFADQAVIAIENARLLTETREALEQQTATAEVLQVINRSPGDLTPVFEAILDKAHTLCGATLGSLFLLDGHLSRATATHGYPDDVAHRLRQGVILSSVPQLLGGARWVHNPDLRLVDNPTARAVSGRGGVRTNLMLPLRKDGRLLGTISCNRQEVRPFTDKEIALLESFAAQAVIAMDNARLLNEIRQRQAELRVTFDNMGDGVAMFDGELRLAAWNLNFQRILELPDPLLAERPRVADFVRYLATHGEYGTVNVEAEVRRLTELVGTQWSAERTRPDGRVIEVRSNPVPGGGVVLIYSDITERKRAEAEIHAARDTAEKALRELQTAQASLLHAQKMAALGQLTAGIAHEIKNPLNFVNNFAELSGELLLELQETTAPAVAALGGDERAAVDEVVEMLRGNLDKIAEHGKRADGIVKSMLEHSRGGSGERRVVNLNTLIEEALNLAYHGARAQDQSFNITLECELAHSIAPIELVPQDMTRVFLNLFGNSFYAAAKRGREAGGPNFRPVLTVTTCDLGEAVEIRVRDNGTGIALEIRDKLFQPFFTTKPTGEGTGLGLSISYDIVTQQHGGTIAVDSRVGEFTEFTIRLPRVRG
jgi:GAF domain-containing protein